jgi:hypothetical protein
MFALSAIVLYQNADNIFKTLAHLNNWPNYLAYPRIHNRKEWCRGSFYNCDPLRFSKYDYIVMDTLLTDEKQGQSFDFVSILQKENPDLNIGISLNTHRPFNDAISKENLLTNEIFPGHFMFFAGSELSEDISVYDSKITVTDGSKFRSGSEAMFWDFTGIEDAEHIRIENVDGNDLTVVRGYKKGVRTGAEKFSPARKHEKGTYLAPHVMEFSENSQTDDWYVNIYDSCVKGTEKSCGKIYRNYSDYIADKYKNLSGQNKLSGIEIDNAKALRFNQTVYNIKELDLNNDGRIDGAQAGNDWIEALDKLASKVRENVLSDMLMQINSARTSDSLRDSLNGRFYPGFMNSGDWKIWDNSMDNYVLAQNIFRHPRVNTVDVQAGQDEYQKVRYSLAATLMGDGFFTNSINTTEGSQVLEAWYDEYDNGAGSSLAEDTSWGQNYLKVAESTGSKFKVNDILYLPGEIVRINSIVDDVLYVTRAFIPGYLSDLRFQLSVYKSGYPQNTLSISHKKGEKLYTLEQVRKTKGYLGKPIDTLVTKCKVESPQNCIRKFHNGIVMVNPSDKAVAFPLDRKYFRINGTQDRLVNNGTLVEKQVSVPPKDGLILVTEDNR